MGTSTGIEPFYSFRYFRKSRLGTSEQLVPLAAEWRAEHPGEELPPHFVTAMDLTPEEHVRVQATVQKYVDASISKTANCPAGYTREQTRELYELAYRLGCKGVTIYRDGSRHEQVLSLPKDGGKAEEEPKPRHSRPRPRPQVVQGVTARAETPNGTPFATL